MTGSNPADDLQHARTCRSTGLIVHRTCPDRRERQPHVGIDRPGDLGQCHRRHEPGP